MKHKKLFRSVTALLAALVLMGGFSVTAFAGGGDVSDELPTPVTETEPEETTGGYEPQPLTPEGNMSLVDDITGEASGDKQFITVVTKNGNYFYIIIDRAEDGENTVHFLNQVDEKDLLQLMEDEQTEAPACSCTEKCVAGSVNTDCPVCSVNMSECAGKEAEPEEPEQPEEETQGNIGGILLILMAIAIIIMVLMQEGKGGGASALVGAAGVALGSMVGSLTVGKKKYAAVEADIAALNVRAEALRKQLEALVGGKKK